MLRKARYSHPLSTSSSVWGSGRPRRCSSYLYQPAPVFCPNLAQLAQAILRGTRWRPPGVFQMTILLAIRQPTSSPARSDRERAHGHAEFGQCARRLRRPSRLPRPGTGSRAGTGRTCDCRRIPGNCRRARRLCRASWPAAMHVAITAGCSLPRTISSSFMTFAGLKKWWPITAVAAWSPRRSRRC